LRLCAAKLQKNKTDPITFFSRLLHLGTTMRVLRFQSLRWVVARSHAYPCAARARRWQRPYTRAAAASTAAAVNRKRHLTIVHFNDVYDISPRTLEPVGGAARFASLVAALQDEHPLVLFSLGAGRGVVRTVADSLSAGVRARPMDTVPMLAMGCCASCTPSSRRAR
jgi:hypothetical protein